MPLFILSALLADANVSPISGVIAGLAFLNTLGIFGLIFHTGWYVGDTNRWRDGVETRLTNLESSITAVHSQEIMQAETKTILEGMSKAISEMKDEIKLVRKRSHDLSNTMARLVLSGSATLAPPIVPEDNKG